MRLPLRRRWSRTASFSLFVVVLFGAVIYSRAVRSVALGDQFQYLPRESEFIIATGELDSIWNGMESLFGRFLQPGGLLEGLGKELRKQKPPITRVDDLRRYGFDTHRALLVGIYRPTTDSDFVAVVPIVNAALIRKTLAGDDKDHLTGPPITDPRSGKTYEYYEFGKDLFAAFPENGLAVVSSSKNLLTRSLTLRSENLAHASNNDGLYDAVRRVSRGPLLVGPSVFVYWQSRTAPFNARSGVLRLSRNEIRIDGEMELSGGTLRVVDDLRRRSEDDRKWIDKLPDQTVSVAVLQDEHLTRYRDFIAEELLSKQFPDAASALQHWAPGLNLPDVQRVAVAMTDYEDGLPDFLVGLWGDRKQLEILRGQLQQAYRKSRDLILISGALAKYHNTGGPPPSLADLQRLHLLQPEQYSLFDRYPIVQGRVGDPEFAPQDFANATYERDINGRRIRFLAPPLGQNDLAYRPGLATADARSLSNDRYRMATVFDEGVLWIASDVRDIESLLTPPAQRKRGLRGPALAPAESGAKLHISVDVDRLITLGLLSPGSDLEKMIKGGLITLQDFSILQIDAVPSIAEDRIRFSATLRRRTQP